MDRVSKGDWYGQKPYFACTCFQSSRLQPACTSRSLGLYSVCRSVRYLIIQSTGACCEHISSTWDLPYVDNVMCISGARKLRVQPGSDTCRAGPVATGAGDHTPVRPRPAHVPQRGCTAPGYNQRGWDQAGYGSTPVTYAVPAMVRCWPAHETHHAAHVYVHESGVCFHNGRW